MTLRIKFTGRHPSDRVDIKAGQKKQKSSGLNLRKKKKCGSQYGNVKRGDKEPRRRARSTTEPGGVGGEQRRSLSYKKKRGSLLLI